MAATGKLGLPDTKRHPPGKPWVHPDRTQARDSAGTGFIVHTA